MPPKSTKATTQVGEETLDVQAGVDVAEATELVAETAQPDVQPTSHPVSTVTARVLVAVTIGDTRYQPNDVIAGLPAALADSHADALDAQPDAIALALGDGGRQRQYGEG